MIANEKNLKFYLRSLIEIVLVGFLKTRVGGLTSALFLGWTMKQKQKIEHDGVSINLCVPNSLLRWRANTFSTKEPETLSWIDSFERGAILWDIGANIGLYSIYAAKKRGALVWAFEPSVFNLEILARNISINGSVENINIMSTALSHKDGINLMRHTNSEWGGALSSFGSKFGHDGQPIDEVCSYKILGLSADFLIKCKLAPPPEHIKIDVDGIEHLILAGATSALKSAKSILLEVNEDFLKQKSECEATLKRAGFVLQEKFLSVYGGEGAHANVYNQIWVKTAKKS